MQHSPELYAARCHDFPNKIREVATNNPVVNKWLKMYAEGIVITKEEALAQMVVELSEKSHFYDKAMLDRFQRSPVETIG